MNPAALVPRDLRLTAAALLALALATPHAHAQSATQETPPDAAAVTPPAVHLSDANQNATELAKKLQNPVGDLYSFPFQNNTNFNAGTHDGTQNILNVQPVIPIHVNEDWNVITRTVLPLVWQPSYAPAHTVPFGTAPVDFSAFLSPKNPVNGWVWGLGPVVQIPTISDKTIGSNVWGLGPTGAVVYLSGPWVVGALVNNIWSMGGTSGSGRTRYNTFLTQPFVNYNFGEGWYVTSAPIVTANWLTSGHNAWTLPVGAGAGRVIKLFDKLPVNLSLSAYYNTLRPDYAGTWQLRTQVTLIF